MQVPLVRMPYRRATRAAQSLDVPVSNGMRIGIDLKRMHGAA
ncbi:hypothetical protein [Trinickia sp. Y13]|nr:hypothetical protein [Trinickia sp. Y13]